MPSASTLLGAAGEHYVMCQLLRRGFIAALAPAGVPKCDILVSDDVGDRLCAIQVKTRNDKGSDGGWHMRRKHEAIASPTLFYTFLDFGRSLTEAPSCFVVPSIVVADVVARAHVAWLSEPGKRGQERRDSDFRRFLPDYDAMGVRIGCGAGWLEPYREKWESLANFAEVEQATPVPPDPVPSASIAPTVGSVASPSGTSTRQPGDVNRNGQRLLARTDRRGNDHQQYAWLLECTAEGCGHRYYANGSDFHQRLCPLCQGGRPEMSL